MRQFNKKSIIIALISLLMIGIVSVPSVLAYFSTYTGTKGTKILKIEYKSRLVEEKDGTNKVISVKSEKEPIFVRVKYFAASDKMTVTPDQNTIKDGETVVWEEKTDGYFYYYQPIANNNSTKPLKLLVTSKTGTDFPVGDVEHVIVIYEAVPVRYDANNQPYADWTQQLHTTTEIIEHETTAVEGGGE